MLIVAYSYNGKPAPSTGHRSPADSHQRPARCACQRTPAHTR
jgi:hypothetical protein